MMKMSVLFMISCLCILRPAFATELHTDILTSTYLGSSFDQDWVAGVRIQSDGSLVVAANIGDRVNEGARVVDLPGFKPPAEEKPDPAAFEDQAAYVEAAIGWIQRNIPGAPPVPKLEDEWIQEEIEERRSRLKKQMRIERVPREVLADARGDYARKWANGWAGGCLLKLSPDGRRVISQLRIGPQVTDLHLDANDNIYLAAGPNGVMSLDPDALTLRSGWPRQAGEFVRRVHASSDGHVITLVGTRPGTLTTFDTRGRQLTKRSGSRRTEDVAIAPEHGLAYFTGYKVTRAPGQEGGEWRTYPVHIPYIKTFDFRTGDDRWTNYDWRGRIKLSGKVGSEGELPDNFLNKSANNMADSRGVRITIGDDGKLYVGMEAAGGNHPMRWEPKDIMAPIGDKMAGGDGWHQFTNTAASHKTVVGRYDAATGDLLRMQEFNTLVLKKGRFPSANALRLHEGEIHADADGRLYLVGGAAFGLPIRHAPRFGPSDDPPNFNPFGRKVPVKGAYFMVMSPDMTHRLFTTRLSPYGGSHTVDARVVDGSMQVAWGGQAILRYPTYTRRALQTSPGWGRADGFLALLGDPGRMAEPEIRRLKMSLVGEGLQMGDLESDRERRDVTGDGEAEMIVRLPFQTGTPVANTPEGIGLYGGFTTQVTRFGSRDVRQPVGFELRKGKLVIPDPGRGANLNAERDAQVRSWTALMVPLKGQGERLAFGRGDRFQLIADHRYNMGEIRALVHDGRGWYLSETDLREEKVITFASDGSDGRWAPFDPVAALAADHPPALIMDRFESESEEEEDPRYEEMNFHNVTSVGLFVAGDWRKAHRAGLQLEDWTVLPRC